MYLNSILNINKTSFGICIVGAIIMVLTMIKQIHIIQLNSYNLDQQILWYKKNIRQFIVNIILLAVIVIFVPLSLYLLYFSFGYSMDRGVNSTLPFWISVLFLFSLLLLELLLLLIIFIENWPRKQKKKLVYTNRIKRLIIICVCLFSLFYLPYLINDLFGYVSVLLGVALSPLVVFIAYLISLPIENAIRNKFKLRAHQIIKANDNLYVIGITGSFGKTSVKHYLHRILQEKYSVCMTPESYNTAMGATLTIKNDLKNINDIFICEMGARRIGDIKEICDIVDPNGAIITDVGNMHLDTFKNIDNVKITKFELADATIKSSKNRFFDKPILLLYGDNDLIREKAKDYDKDKVYLYHYGMNEYNDFNASILSVSQKGTKFKYHSTIFGEEEFETKLLGKYSIINLVAAISYALLLKVDISIVKKAIKSIETVPHRLQVIPYGNIDLLIDDAYNSNPKGARAAADVLASFDGYKKVIITPGMVELKDKQDYENESFAEYAGKNIDYAVIVGKTNKDSLLRGFEKSMNKDKVFSFESFDEAIKFVNSTINDKKVILIENDLSDNY